MPWRFRLLPFVVFIAACSAEMPGIYRLDIQQGNVLDAPMLARFPPAWRNARSASFSVRR